MEIEVTQLDGRQMKNYIGVRPLDRNVFGFMLLLIMFKITCLLYAEIGYDICMYTYIYMQTRLKVNH